MPDVEIEGPLFPLPRPYQPLANDVVDIQDRITEAPGQKRIPLPHQQETARRRIAYLLIGIFAVEVLFALVAHWLPPNLWWDAEGMTVADIKEIMVIVFGPTGALVGSATGFYFAGVKTDEERSGRAPPPQP